MKDTVSTRLSRKILHLADEVGRPFCRSAPKQIEYWAKLGYLMERHPKLTYLEIKKLLLKEEED